VDQIHVDRAAPALTVVLPTWDTFDALRTTVAHLTAQTVAESIELIICAPSAERAMVDAETVRGLHSVRVLETGPLRETGPVRARAVREAAARVVAFAEDHCFPYPDWAEALLAAHAEPHAAVGPAVHNANPESTISWADLLIEYGRWVAPGRRREVEMLPGHNSSYKRDVLLAYGNQLDSLMEAETVLFWDLRRRGYTLLFEPAARVRHTNFSRLRPFLHVQWHLGRAFAGKRAEPWSLARRAAYALASPAIPFIRLSHVFRAAIENRVPLWRLVLISPVVVAGLAVDCVAQATGAAFGGGRSTVQLTAYEFHRGDVNRTRQPPAAP
jgi:glycosyl transferase family 2